ncbi:hypothetical protein CARUB_v10006535mg [Capsella rubella]|uniref:F-box domain-containing protein n=1 Tax=Capsella rubella TaxID=81985 RepID=R0H3J0_9BRAS|nr:hypothetical protein CARUB_v10006535mg [Capsella rubella]
MASSSSVPSLMKDEEPRNWAKLPSELTSLILTRLSVIDILENAQKVCKPWYCVCKDPSMWRKIDMQTLEEFLKKYDLESMCRNAVDRSQGGLLEIDIWHFGTDDLLNYIADSNLRSLRLVLCSQITDKGVAKAVVKLPFLEELDISYCAFSGDSVRVLNNIAIAIGETMPELRHLQLLWNEFDNMGLNAILDGCPHLEHLDLSSCFNLRHDDAIEKRLSERIEVLRLPDVSTSSYSLCRQ